MYKQNEIIELMKRPLWQMTGEEFMALFTHACTLSKDSREEDCAEIRIAGVRALAKYLDCCESTVYMLLRHHVLDSAIMSRIGKRIVFSGETARRCADAYQEQQRAEREREKDK